MTDPIRLRVRDRIYDVLKAVREGADYFYTAGQVERRFIAYDEVKRSPCYMVSTDTGGSIEQVQDLFIEDFYVNVKCWIQDKDDPVSILERALADVRTAINADTLPTAGTGSLADLDALVFFDEPPTTDNGYLSLEGYAFFEQRIKIQVSGTWQ
jgi:hypothetical protein